jgi:chromosome segregation ATPase
MSVPVGASSNRGVAAAIVPQAGAAESNLTQPSIDQLEAQKEVLETAIEGMKSLAAPFLSEEPANLELAKVSQALEELRELLESFKTGETELAEKLNGLAVPIQGFKNKIQELEGLLAKYTLCQNPGDDARTVITLRLLGVANKNLSEVVDSARKVEEQIGFIRSGQRCATELIEQLERKRNQLPQQAFAQ